MIDNEEEGPEVTWDDLWAALPEKYRQRLRRLEHETGQRPELKQMGSYGKGYCPICNGYQYVFCTEPGRRRAEFVVKCGACGGTGLAGKEVRSRQAYRQAGIPAPYQKRIADFRSSSPAHKQALALARGWIEAIHGGKGAATERGLGLFGPPGTGKTTLACMICVELCHAGIAVRFHSWPQFVAELRASQGPGGPGMEALYEDVILGAEVLLLDDVGSSESDWTRELLQRALDLRYYHSRPLIVTSNVRSTEEQDVFGEAIASRLRGYLVRLPLGGNDLRREAAT